MGIRLGQVVKPTFWNTFTSRSRTMECTHTHNVQSQGLFRGSWLHSHNLGFKDLVPVPSALRHNCYFVSAFPSVLHNVRTMLQFSRSEFLAWNWGSLLYGSVNMAPGHVGILAWSLLMRCWWARNRSHSVSIQPIHSTYQKYSLERTRTKLHSVFILFPEGSQVGT